MTATARGAYATTAALKALIGTTDSDDDATLGLICDRVNMMIETKTQRVLAPITSAVYLYDGDGTRSLFLPKPESFGDGTACGPIGGIRAVTLVEIAYYTSGSFGTVPSTDYFLRQSVGMTGPYERLVFTDVPHGSFAYWPEGFSTVRVTGTAGWEAIPDDITELALAVAQRAWNARSQGQQDVAGTDEQGRPIVSRFLSGRDRDTLRYYTLAADLA